MWLSYMQGSDFVMMTKFSHEHGAAFWLMGVTLLTSRVHLPDVARRADRRVRPGQRRQPDHPGRHRVPHADGPAPADTTSADLSAATPTPGAITPGKIATLLGLFIFIIMGSILITQAQRRIPVQQAKHVRGRQVYGGGKQFLPLRVNHGGVMPIIFAQSLMLFPGVAWASSRASWAGNKRRALRS